MFETERKLLLKDAFKAALPDFESPPPPATQHRWTHAGIVTPAGRVVLESVRLGGRYHTSVEAVRRFLEAINNRPEIETSPSVPTPAQRKRNAMAATAALIAAGA